MKKIISGIMAVTMLCGAMTALSGCGNSAKTDDKLLWYVFGDKPADHDMVMAKANEIIKAEIGMELDLQYIDSASYEEKMKLKMASAEPYDLAFTGYINPFQPPSGMG